VFAKATDDEWDLILGDFGVFAIRLEALSVELLERLSREFEPALAGRGVAGRRGLFCLVHDGNLPETGASQQEVCGLGLMREDLKPILEVLEAPGLLKHRVRLHRSGLPRHKAGGEHTIRAP
jgi:hypothetical protein